MPKWEYRRLFVWIPFAPSTANLDVRKDDRGWYIEFKDSVHPAATLFRSKLYAGGKSRTRLPLNPDREWENVHGSELVTWDDHEEWADLAMEVISRLGEDGWELAGIHPNYPWVDGFSGFYIFKRPQD